MKLSRKFDIYTALIALLLISVFAVSINTINFIIRDNTNLLIISREFDYLARLKNSVNDLDHTLDLFLNIAHGKRDDDAVKRSLSEFERILKLSKDLKLDTDGLQTVKFANDNFREFSIVANSFLEDKTKNNQQNIAVYTIWKNNYLGKILSQIDKRWNEDLKKASNFFQRAETSKEKALKLFSLTAVIMFFGLLASRFLVRRFIVKPLKTMEIASNAIARGETENKIDITSNDELGSLSKSINIMAEAINDKIRELHDSISKEQALVREQTILNELMAFIASGADIKISINTFLDRTRDLLKSEHSGIFILERIEESSEPVLQNFFNTFEEKIPFDCAKTMFNGIFKEVLKNNTPLMQNSLMGNVPATHLEIKNMLAVPLISLDKKLLGIIAVVNKYGGFTKDDENTLSNFSFQAFQVITIQQEIIYRATTDGLTGLNNHRIFMEKIEDEVERSRRYSRDLSIFLIDIDHFKSYNDIYGHQAGDKALKKVAKLIISNLRNTDFAARYGGEEFTVILTETDGQQALIAAERLRNSVSKHKFTLEKGEHAHLTISIGIATFPDDADTSEMIIRKADYGLYFAKENGRNMVCRYDDVLKKGREKVPGEIEAILYDSSLTSIKELAKAIDSKSNYMRGHSFEVAALAVMTGKKLELGADQIEALKIASLLHDIGNLGIPDNILNKPSSLTDEEKKIIQSHPGLHEMLLKHYKGYPSGLKEDEIPISAKILGLVEAYHAMTSSRPYKKRKTKLEAIAEMEQEAGKQFDPAVVKIFIDLLKNIEDPAEKRKKADA